MEIQKAPLRSSGSFFTWSRTLPSIIIRSKMDTAQSIALPSSALTEVRRGSAEICGRRTKELNAICRRAARYGYRIAQPIPARFREVKGGRSGP
jgi:hypothetical protein